MLSVIDILNEESKEVFTKKMTFKQRNEAAYSVLFGDRIS